MKITKRLIRKVKNRDEFKISLDMVKDSGKTHSITQFVSGSRGKARGIMAMHLRNHSQKTKVVKFSY